MTKPELTNGRVNQPLVVCLLAVILTAIGTADSRDAAAQGGVRSGSDVVLNNGIPREVSEVKIEQKLGGRIQLNLPMRDSRGERVESGYFIDGNKPTIITLNYSGCPMLCSVQLDQLTKSLGKLDLKIGQDFQLLTVSIDPKEKPATAAKTKAKYIDMLRRTQPSADEGWAFCTADQSIITRLADNLGFRYTYDSKSGEYYHPAMLAFVSPTGVITRYSLTVDFPPADLKKALVEAGEGSVGTPVDQVLLWCFSYDPDSNSYVPQAWQIMRLAGAGTVGLMIACLAPYWIGRKALPKLKNARNDPEKTKQELGTG
ncbi:MAG: electron transporter [Planctomycetaceae bacterium TMED240]|nr:electron transporter [Rhodopirellula sp.]OUX04468.1 MAG: electron transporter [Planctomycetaceae bacterium TMED240]